MLLTGCTDRTRQANVDLRKKVQGLESQIEQLNRKRDADAATIRALEQQHGTVSTVPQDRLDQLAARGRNPVPKEIRFTSWTLKYNRMFWLTIDASAAHWERARVSAAIEGDTMRATTSGVRSA